VKLCGRGRTVYDAVRLRPYPLVPTIVRPRKPGVPNAAAAVGWKPGVPNAAAAVGWKPGLGAAERRV